MKRTSRTEGRRDPRVTRVTCFRALVGMAAALLASSRAFMSAMVARAEHSAATIGSWYRPDPFDDDWASSDYDQYEWMTTRVDDTEWPSHMEEPRTNPATGFSMSGGIDAGGNPYGWSDWSAGSDQEVL